MRQIFVLTRFAVVLSSLIALSAYADNADSASAKTEAQTWLKKIQSAAQKLNYSGTFIYQQGTQIRTSRITHIADGKNEIEKLEILDGRPREYVRNNEEIIYYVPEAKTLLIEKRVVQDVFPAILTANPSDLAEHYDLKLGEIDRVAGADCQAVLLEPKDNLRYGYKLWADKASGLLLRAQTLNEKNQVVEQIAFAQITIANIDRSRIKPSFNNTGNWHIENAQMSQVSLPDWTVRWVPPGFKKIRELKRLISDTPALSPASNTGAAPAHSAQREVTQIIFSDGLASISIFIEPGSQSRTEGSMQQGAMNVIGKRQGDFWLTIVGEVPAAAVRQVANSIEFKGR